MAVLRQSCRVIGIGQKSRIGRLGAGAAIGALVAGFASPGFAANYSAGGGIASGTDSIAIGLGSTSNQISGVAIGVSNAASSNDTNQQQIIDRTNGTGVLAYGNGDAFIVASATAIGDDNAVAGNGGVAIGDRNVVNSAFAGFAVGNGNSVTGGFSSAVGVGNSVTGSSSSAMGVANVAAGNTSVAIGRQNSATGQTSIAMGNVATASETNAIAIGHSTQATAIGAIAIGGGVNGASTILDATAAKATAANSVAIGTSSTASGITSFAGGSSSTATGAASVALGNAAASNTANSLALGSSASAGASGGTTSGETAVGAGAQAVGVEATALGRAANAAVQGATALGSRSRVTGQDSTAIGFEAVVTGVNSTAIGNQLTVSGTQSFAAMSPGGASTVSGNNAVVINPEATGRTYAAADITAVGAGALASAAGATSLGRSSNAAGTNSTAIGFTATASGITSFAGGSNTTASGASSVALGNAATASKTYSIAIGEGAVASTADNTTAIGRNASSTGLNGIALGLNSRQSGGGIAAGNDTAATGLVATSIGYRNSAAGDLSTAIGATNTATGKNSVALGVSTTSSGTSSIAIGDGAVASNTNTIAIGTGNKVSGANSGAIGDPNTVSGSGSYALGNNNTIGANNAFAIGSGITIAAGRDGSVGLGDGTTVAAPNTGAFTLNGGTAAATAPSSVVSVGAAGSERQVTNVAAGVVSATSTDAINGSQLYIVATAANSLGDSLETVTGGGLVINPDGTIATPPSIAAAGSTYATVTSAIEALDNANTTANTGLVAALGGGATIAANGTVTNPTYTVAGGIQTNVGDALDAIDTALASGTIGLVQQNGGSPGSGRIIVGNATGGTSVSFNGTDGTRLLTGVSAGSTVATSLDAVNGSQINTLASSIAANTGGGSAFDPVTGTVTAPTVNVGGTAYTDLTSAIEAAGAGFKLTSAATGSGTVSGTSIEGIGGGETVTLTAGNNINVTQTGNALTVALSPVLTGLTSLAVTGGATLDANGIAMNGDKITGLAAGSTAAGSTEAVNGAQLNIGLTSVATDLGGGATYDPLTGKLTAPGYAIDGTTHNTVGDALAALAADSKFVDFNSTLAAASASGSNASAIGPNAQAAGDNASALGVNSTASGTSSLALGSGAMASGTNSVALGAGSVAGTSNTGWTGTVFGGQTMTNAHDAIAVVSVSGGGINRQLTGVADGAVNATSTDAVNGAQLFATATALNEMSTNIGAGLAASLGGGAAVAADGTVTNPSIDVNGATFTNVTDAIAAAGAGFKFTTAASGTGAMTGTTVDGIGAGETLTIMAGNNLLGTQNANGVELALNPALTGITSLAVTGGATLDANGIAMNGDKITGLAEGSTAAGSKEAVNGDQLHVGLASVATSLGGGSSFDPVTGLVTAPSYTIGGSTYTNVGSALGALATGGAGPVQYANAATPTVPNGGTPSNNLTLVGASAGPVVLDNVSAGNLAAASTQAVNGGQINGLAASVASSIGGAAAFDPLTGTITGTSISVGGNVYTDITSAVQAAGGGLKVTTAATGTGIANGTSLTTIAPGETATLTAGDNIITTQLDGNIAVAVNPVLSGLTSMAIAGGPTISAAGISGVAAGAVTATSTDAVNGAQLYATNQTVTNLANGTAGLVQQSPASPSAGTITVGAATGGTVVDFKNDSDTDRVLTGIAAGATTASSVEAVNGGQINTALGSVASHLGGGATFDPLTGTVSAPSYTVAGTTQDDVGRALAALDAGNSTANTGLANAIGGGAAVAADGTVTAPTINVNGTTFTNLTDAVQAAGAGSKLTTSATGSGVATGSSLTAVGAGDTVTLTAGNNIAISQNGRDVTVALNADITGLNSVTITGGPAISATGITGLAAGNIAAGSTDAVNGGQIYALANALGMPVGPGGAVTAPTYTVNGDTYANVGTALSAVDAAISGGGIKYFHANSTLSDSAPVGVDSVAIGPVSGSAGTASITIGFNTSAAGDNAIAQGNGASASGNNSIAIGTGNQVSGNNSGAFGDPNVVTGNDSYAFGNNNTVAANQAFALGNNITIAAGQTGSVGIGDGSTVAGANTGAFTLVGGTAAATAPTAVVSVGASGSERQVTNVAAGVVSATSTDAINGSQMFLAQTATTNMAASIGTLIGGGTQIAADGTVLTAPTFTLRGSTYNDIGTALTALASGGTGPVQYTDSATPTVPNGGNPSQHLTLVGGAAGAVSLNNLAAGAVTATSTDAVNGAQLFAVQAAADGALQRSGGTMTGAINMGGQVIANLAGPVNASDAANKAYVDGVAATAGELGRSTAAALGAGSTYDPASGKVSAPSYSVGGKSYADTGSALAATNLLAVQYVADASGAPTNAVRLTGNGNGQPVALGNVAPGVVAAGSLDAVNGGQLHTVQLLASNSLQYDRNPNGSSNFASVTLGGASATAPTALRNVAQGVAPTDAVNVLQLATAQQSTLGLANTYTDRAVGQLSFDLNRVAKRAYGGTAAAIALQAPALFDPGTVSMRGGMGYYRGEIAMGLSVRATADNGRWSLTGGISGGRNSGVAASAGIDFVLGN